MPALFASPPFRVPDPPNPPRYDLWPIALRSAARLRGALVPCGPGLRGIGWPETPRVRVAALAEYLSAGQVPILLSAAWVWGAANDPGRPLTVSTVGGRRKATADTPMLRTMERRVEGSDLTRLGDFTVTTPQRTAIDLLHLCEEFGVRERVACRLLAAAIPGGLMALDAHLQAHRKPHRSRARSRLLAILTPSGLEHLTAQRRLRPHDQ